VLSKSRAYTSTLHPTCLRLSYYYYYYYYYYYLGGTGALPLEPIPSRSDSAFRDLISRHLPPRLSPKACSFFLILEPVLLPHGTEVFTGEGGSSGETVGLPNISQCSGWGTKSRIWLEGPREKMVLEPRSQPHCPNNKPSLPVPDSEGRPRTSHLPAHG
jgi:hypothetical protein